MAFKEASEILSDKNQGNWFMRNIGNQLGAFFRVENWKFAIHQTKEGFKNLEEGAWPKIRYGLAAIGEFALDIGGLASIIGIPFTLLRMLWPDATLSRFYQDFGKSIHIAEAKRRDDTFKNPFINDYYNTPTDDIQS